MRIVHVTGTPEQAVLAAAAACIANHGTLIFPTETVYGLGCDPESAEAVRSVFAAKGRPHDKPLAVHLARPGDARQFAQRLSPTAERIIERFWPGPVALIVQRKSRRARYAALGWPTISLRCPSDHVCSSILRATGPLAATSANVSGAAPFCGDAGEIRFLPEATLAIITGRVALRKESTILDCNGPVVKVIREGALSATAIAAALGDDVLVSA